MASNRIRIDINITVRRPRRKLPKPAALTAAPMEKSEMANKLGYNLGLPALGAADVAKRRLSITRDGQEEFVELTPLVDTGNFQQTYELVVEQKVSVVAKLKDIDFAGNESPYTDDLSFVAADKTPPDKPGAMFIIGEPRIIPDDVTPVTPPSSSPVDPPSSFPVDPPVSSPVDPPMSMPMEPVAPPDLPPAAE